MLPFCDDTIYCKILNVYLIYESHYAYFEITHLRLHFVFHIFKRSQQARQKSRENTFSIPPIVQQNHPLLGPIS